MTVYHYKPHSIIKFLTIQYQAIYWTENCTVRGTFHYLNSWSQQMGVEILKVGSFTQP